ncbi:MAG: RusA family crossover junction endodeoxyribonuclease [Planctomycetota bacterium]|jgi:crossover junction endodeoxyribonuclease RusA|nr:RusA family crossover junction endodeoxyribonuclease [Planctomycetota bacterium]
MDDMNVADLVEIRLPWPPSVNHYYGRARAGGVFLKPAGRKYRQAVALLLAARGWPRISGPVEVRLRLAPPDNRRRDIDNVRKAVYDAISDRPGHRGIIADDADIRRDWADFIKSRDGTITVAVAKIFGEDHDQEEKPGARPGRADGHRKKAAKGD